MTVHVTAETARAFGVETGVKRRHKFNAKPVFADGHRFDSSAEHRRYCELKILRAANEISELQIHPRFPLIVANVNCGVYVGDFAYFENATGKSVCEDVKGGRATQTQLFVFKSKIFRALYPHTEFRIIET